MVASASRRSSWSTSTPTALRVGRPFSNWLLVFDNAERPADVERFLPRGGPGSIVVTSRNEAWREVADSLPVTVFDRDESVQMLRGRGPDPGADSADRLARALGDLPLAIELAAAWRAETGSSADTYLDLLGQGDDAAWNVSLDCLAAREPEALRLLEVCAYFAPEPISTTMLSRRRDLRIHPDIDPLIRSTARLRNAIRTIGRLSLARIDHRVGTFQLHRLLHRVLIARMSTEEREVMQHGAHLLLAGNDPNAPYDAEHWPRYAELYPHVVSSGAAECPDEPVRDLVLNESKYLWWWGEHHGAHDLARRVHTARPADGDPTDPATLHLAGWLGHLHFVVGDYPAAARLNAETLRLYRESLGEDHEETLDAVGAVASDHRVAGDFDGALELSRAVYDSARRQFGDDDPFTLRAAHNLAVSMRLSGRFRGALRLDEQTRRRFARTYGPDHPDTLQADLTVNIDRRELGLHVAAHESQETVAATARRVLRYDDHPGVLMHDHNLASLRRTVGDHLGALRLSHAVRHRYRQRYGDDHPATVLATLTLSIDQRTAGDLDTARELGEEAVAALRRLYGPDHPHTAGAEVDLAVTLRLLGEPGAARTLDERALDRLVDRLGGSHPQVLAARVNLAGDHHALGAHQRAEALDRETLDRCREHLPRDHPTTLACAANLAMDLTARGRDGDALFDETLDRYRAALGGTHPLTMAAAARARMTCDIEPMPL